MSLPYQKALLTDQTLKGNIAVLDVQYGNIWTNIDANLFKKLPIKYGDKLHFTIFHQGTKVYEGEAPYVETFGDVAEQQPLAYLNSLLQLSFAINQGNFAATHQIGSGSEWSIEVGLLKK